MSPLATLASLLEAPAGHAVASGVIMVSLWVIAVLGATRGGRDDETEGDPRWPCTAVCRDAL